MDDPAILNLLTNNNAQLTELSDFCQAPDHCFNDVQDGDEGGVDCCAIGTSCDCGTPCDGTNPVNPPPGINYILQGEVAQIGCEQSPHPYSLHVKLLRMNLVGNYTLKIYSSYNSQQWTQSGTFGSESIYYHCLPIMLTPSYPPGTHVNFLVELRIGGANGEVLDSYVFSHTFNPQTDAGPPFREACVGQAIQLGGPMSSLSQRHWEITSPANTQATLGPANGATPSFIAYANGNYTVRLTTSRSGGCVETRDVADSRFAVRLRSARPALGRRPLQSLRRGRRALQPGRASRRRRTALFLPLGTRNGTFLLYRLAERTPGLA